VSQAAPWRCRARLSGYIMESQVQVRWGVQVPEILGYVVDLLLKSAVTAGLLGGLAIWVGRIVADRWQVAYREDLQRANAEQLERVKAELQQANNEQTARLSAELQRSNSEEVERLKFQLQRQSEVSQRQLDAYHKISEISHRVNYRIGGAALFDSVPATMDAQTAANMLQLHDEMVAWLQTHALYLTGSHLSLLIDAYRFSVWSYGSMLQQAIQYRDSGQIDEMRSVVSIVQENEQQMRVYSGLTNRLLESLLTAGGFTGTGT
jgi:hypothetical protein